MCLPCNLYGSAKGYVYHPHTSDSHLVRPAFNASTVDFMLTLGKIYSSRSKQLPRKFAPDSKVKLSSSC